MPFLSLHAVSVRYAGRALALCDVDLAVERGETLALVGESGSGKTTLLRCVNRMVVPSSGELRLEGTVISDRSPEALRRRMGYVQQEGGLLPHWTVRHNVELVPRLCGWASERRRTRGDELLAMVGLPPAEFADRFPVTLSGGQRQRVAFARALAADPPLLLLDEPFGALDPLRRRELQNEFLRWKSTLQKTTLLVTHDMAEALRLADRIAVLREGRLLQLATGEELASAPADPYVSALLEGAGG